MDAKKFIKKVSGKSNSLPQLEKMIDQLRTGDVVVVWKLDRLGRSLRDLIDLVSAFREKGVEFVSLKDGIDTGTATGWFNLIYMLPWQSFKGKSSGSVHQFWLAIIWQGCIAKISCKLG